MDNNSVWILIDDGNDVFGVYATKELAIEIAKEEIEEEITVDNVGDVIDEDGATTGYTITKHEVIFE